MAPRIKYFNEKRRYRTVGAVLLLAVAAVTLLVVLLAPKDAGGQIQQHHTICHPATVPATDPPC